MGLVMSFAKPHKAKREVIRIKGRRRVLGIKGFLFIGVLVVVMVMWFSDCIIFQVFQATLLCHIESKTFWKCSE
jgi:hypothetical protein